MKILVMGLCLSRNLGGPAMALTLVKELRSLKEDLDFIFAVSAIDFEYEKIWANRYNLKVIPSAELSTYLSHFTLFRYIVRLIKGYSLKYIRNAFNFWKKVIKEHFDAIKQCDAIICMNGISYVGDGSRGYLEGINSVGYFLLSKLFKRPYIRFVQSFGPINRFDVYMSAKIEFKYLPFIFARGEISKSECLKILPRRSWGKVEDYPDIAILLPKTDENWTQKYLSNLGLGKSNFVVLSPSSVIYKILFSYNFKLKPNEYIFFYRMLAEFFVNEGYKVLFVPHMYSSKKNECDREICYKILEKKSCNFLVIRDDLDPMQTKSIISYSNFAIVSRYHALVAALSTSTKVVSIGWNIKYCELMNYYGLGEFSIDCRNYSLKELFDLTILKIRNYPKIDFNKANFENIMRVKNAFKKLERWLNECYEYKRYL